MTSVSLKGTALLRDWCILAVLNGAAKWEKFMNQQVVKSDEFEQEFLRHVREDDGAAAEAMLAAGKPIHIRRDDTPPSHVIRVHPNGREELVHVDLSRFVRRMGA